MTSTRPKPKVVIVGCGVSGLTCGICLLEAQFEVTIVTRDLPPQTTSNIAPAIWYPYKAYPPARVLNWGRVSLDMFYHLAATPDCGVSLLTLIELFEQPVGDPWWRGAVRHFDYLPAAELPPGYQSGYKVEIPLIEAPIYLAYLLSRFWQLGGQLEQVHLSALSELYQPGRLIINCAGLGAREIAGDEQLYPIRGQIVRVEASGLRRVINCATGAHAPAYIIPRRHDCILGGTATEHDWNMEINPVTAQEILAKCRQLEPALNDMPVLSHVVGLRPGRHEVRLELEWLAGQFPIIHNYGHGGAGFTLSWGCAKEVVELALTWPSQN
jgi:D-amino-acid oxidase